LDMDEDVERLELAVDVINREKPEFVFLTGDYFSGPDTMRRYVGAFRMHCPRLNPKVGVFASQEIMIIGRRSIPSPALWKPRASICSLTPNRPLKLKGEQLVHRRYRRICGRGAPSPRARLKMSRPTPRRSSSRTIPTPRSTRVIWDLA